MSATTKNGGDPAGVQDTEPSGNPLLRLTDEQLATLGKEFDDLHDQVKADLGERDATYIHAIIGLQRRLALLGRLELMGARSKPLWVAGTATLSMAKILENMEIGHNVLHGQWDWMNHPVINSTAWDWDTASTAEAWRHSHNYVHHTYTNIRGKDKDLGYEIMRIDPAQKWHPVYILQPFYNLALMAFFEWGVASHDLDLEAIRKGEKSKEDLLKDLKGIAGKARFQIQKDYIAWPLLSAAIATGVEWAVRSREDSRRPKFRLKRKPNPFDPAAAFRQNFKATVWADFSANIIRNVWTHAIIFCGHFPDQTYTFSEEEVRDEQPGGRYVRQLLGAANIEGSPSSTSSAATSATRSSTTSTPTCPRRATARSPRACARSASATTSPTTPAPSVNSGAWSCAPSPASPSPAASRARSRGPTAGRPSCRRASGIWCTRRSGSGRATSSSGPTPAAIPPRGSRTPATRMKTWRANRYTMGAGG